MHARCAVATLAGSTTETKHMSSVSTHPTPPLSVEGPFHRVLAASSLDEAGRWAVQRAALLPLAPGARLELLHVSSPWSGGQQDRTRSGVRSALEDALAEAGERARQAGHRQLELVAQVAEGWPAREIVRAAWRSRAELVVVGPPATRFDGSPRATVARLLRWVGLPVLVVRREPSREYRRALCAVDRTITAADTVDLASRLAPSRSLTLFHAYHVPFEKWLGSAPELEAEALGYLWELARELGPAARIDLTFTLPGDRCVQIPRAARMVGADLVVLGTRGRAGLARSLSASAAQWVLACANADVAIARRHGLALARS